MTDCEYMDIFNLSKTIYDLVFLDGPHTTKDILKEALWFAERSRKGSRIIIDDFRLFGERRDYPSKNFLVNFSSKIKKKFTIEHDMFICY